jgi:cysteine-rich repeat protein
LCLRAPVCGNQQIEFGEACDDGNTEDGDECNAVCKLDCAGGRTWQLHCYRVLGADAWAASRLACQGLGMDLVTIDSRQELLFVTALRDELANNTYYWLGLNDLDLEGTFVWVSGAEVTYTNWAPGEPNDIGGDEDCATVFRAGDSWYDYPCQTSCTAVCEAD